MPKPQDNVNAEDLETLQNEIERRLVDVVTERWKLERELEALNDSSPDANNQPIVAPTATTNDCVQDSTKTPNNLSTSQQQSTTLPGGKIRNSLKLRKRLKVENVSDRLVPPDKLWPFVEQFCSAPTEDQMKSLEGMIKSMENDKEYYKIPPLMKKDISVPDSPSKDDNSSNSNGNSSKNQRKSKSKNESEISLGALTQRLVSSLIEEAADNDTEVSKSSSETSSPPIKKRKSKSNKGIDASKAKSLEKRIRQQLEEHSIISQQDDIPYSSEEDGNLRELLVYQHELLSIQTQNKHSMQTLLKKATRHLELEKEREKLREANSDVMAAYRKLILAKQRKRNPTEREKEAAWKALEIHDLVFKKCDELYMTSLDRKIV